MQDVTESAMILELRKVLLEWFSHSGTKVGMYTTFKFYKLAHVSFGIKVNGAASGVRTITWTTWR